MTGKFMAGAIVLSGILAGIAVFYLQVYHFYREIPATGHGDVVLVNLVTGAPEPIIADDFRAIDADSSPIRYRACFDTPLSIPLLTETYEPYEGAEPRNAPYWFDCFDADAIGAAIAAGDALVFTATRNIEYGIDRVVAIHSDGRGWVWHEINDCGDRAYDGTPLGEDCPPRP